MSGFKVAIIGMSGRFPKASSVDELWHNLLKAKNCSTRLKDDSSDPAYVPVRGVLEHADAFDAAFFSYSPEETKLMDPQQRIFLECAWSALEDAGYVPDACPGPVGVFAGESPSTYLKAATTGADIEDSMLLQIGNQPDFIATRVSYKLNLTGPSMTVQTGCSTSLVAVHLACQSLLAHECDLALAGGSSIRFPQEKGYTYTPGGVYSPDGLCRAFDEKAQGVFSGNASAIVVLKRFHDAVRDGDDIRGVILATSVNNDGNRKIGFTAPSEDGQSEGMSAALSLAEIEPDQVGFVEAHGTGTALGDTIEFAGLKRAFADVPKSSCALGAVKTNLGHLDSAAGVTGLIKATLAVESGVIPATLNFTKPNPKLSMEASPFFVNATTTQWRQQEGPRVAAVNSFGIGGTNAHVVIEQYESEKPEHVEPGGLMGEHLLPVSARSASALQDYTDRLQQALHPGLFPQHATFTMTAARKVFSHRAVAIGRTTEELASALREPTAENFISGLSQKRKICFLFPGGGTQYFPMAQGLYANEPMFLAVLDECAQHLLPILGQDIREFLLGPVRELSQPHDELSGFGLVLASLFAVEYALARALMNRGLEPDGGMIGHSLGEYVAATLAGVFELHDALNLIVCRGALLAKCARGAMLSVRASEDQVHAAGLPPGASISAYNAPELLTISGSELAVSVAETRLTQAGLECRRIPLQAAAHCALLDPVLSEYREQLSRISLRPPRLPFISNLTGSWISDEDATSPSYWVRHFREPVCFSRGLAGLIGSDDVVLVECGPGRTLTGLVRANSLNARQAVAVNAMRSKDGAGTDERLFSAALAKVWVAGGTIDWKRVQPCSAARRVRMPTYPFERRRHWLTKGKVEKGQRGWFYAKTWKHNPSPANPGEIKIRRALFCGRGANLNDAFNACKKLGIDARVWNFDTDLVPALHSSWQPDAVLFFSGFGTSPRELLESAFQLVRERIGRTDYIFIGHGVAVIEPGDRIEPNQSPLLAAAAIMPQELEGVRALFADVNAQTPADWEDAVMLLLSHREYLLHTRAVAVRSLGLFLPEFTELPLTSAARVLRPLREHGVYLITGGLGKVGLHLAAHLARTYKARIILLARRANPTAEQQRIIKVCEESGGEVLVLQGDVSELDSLRESIRKVREHFGSLNGVLHAAGVTSGPSMQALIPDVTEGHFREQFTPKAGGTLALERALEGVPLDFVMLFSSNAAILGGLGLLPYASANIFMDLFAEQKFREGDRRWISATWDGWRVNDDAGPGRQTSLDALAMQPEENLSAFEAVVMRSPVPTTLVSRISMQSRARRWLATEINQLESEQPNASPQGEAGERDGLSVQYVQAADEVEVKLVGIWENMLGVRQIGTEDSFFDLGGHSLFATRMVTRIADAFSVDFPLFRLFEKPTIKAIAAIIRSLPKKANAPVQEILPVQKSKTLAELLSQFTK